MLESTLAIFNALAFFFLAAIHFYWAFGGRTYLQSVIPEKYKPIFFDCENRKPIAVATFLIAMILLAISILVLRSFFWKETIVPYVHEFVASVFLLRAVGDFSICGIFKKKSNSNFYRFDSRVVIPLCLVLSIVNLCLIFTSLEN